MASYSATTRRSFTNISNTSINSPESALIHNTHVNYNQITQTKLAQNSSSQHINSPNQIHRRRSGRSGCGSSSYKYDDDTLSFHSARSDSEFNESLHSSLTNSVENSLNRASVNSSLKRLSLPNTKNKVHSLQQSVTELNIRNPSQNSTNLSENKNNNANSTKFNGQPTAKSSSVPHASNSRFDQNTVLPQSTKTRPKNLPGIAPVCGQSRSSFQKQSLTSPCESQFSSTTTTSISRSNKSSTILTQLKKPFSKNSIKTLFSIKNNNKNNNNVTKSNADLSSPRRKSSLQSSFQSSLQSSFLGNLPRTAISETNFHQKSSKTTSFKQKINKSPSKISKYFKNHSSEGSESALTPLGPPNSLFKPLKTFISGSYQGDKLKQENLRQWSCINEHTATPSPRAINVCKFSPCGRLLATAGEDGVIWIWVLKQFRSYFEKQNLVNKNSGNGIDLVGNPKIAQNDTETHHNIAPTTSHIGVGNSAPELPAPSVNLKSSLKNSLIPIEDTNPFGMGPFTTLIGHEAEIYDVSWSGSSTAKVLLISASRDGSVLLWDVGGQQEPMLMFDHKDVKTKIPEPIISVHFMQDVRLFISVTFKGVIRSCSALDKCQTKCLSLNLPDKHQVTTVSLANNTRTMLIGTSDGRILIYDLQQVNLTKISLQLLNEISLPKKTRVNKIKTYTPILNNSSSTSGFKTVASNAVYKSKGCDNVIVTTADKKIRIYETKDWTNIATFKGFSGNDAAELDGASLSPDHKILTMVGGNSEVFVFPYSSSENGKGNSKAGSIPGNQYFNPGYASKSWIGICTNNKREEPTNTIPELTSCCIAPRTDFFLDFINRHTDIKFKSKPKYVLIVTDTHGKIKVVVNGLRDVP